MIRAQPRRSGSAELHIALVAFRAAYCLGWEPYYPGDNFRYPGGQHRICRFFRMHASPEKKHTRTFWDEEEGAPDLLMTMEVRSCSLF